MHTPIKQHGMSLIELTVVLFILLALAGVAVPYISNEGNRAACIATDSTLQNVKQVIVGGGSGVSYTADMLGDYPKYSKGTGTADYNLRYLFSQNNSSAYNLKTGVGWRGPYLQNGITLITGQTYAAANLAAGFKDSAGLTPHVHVDVADNDSVILDAWSRPIILQVPIPADCDTLTGLAGTKIGYCARLVSAGAGAGMALGDADIDTTLASGRANDDRVLYLNLATPASEVNPICD